MRKNVDVDILPKIKCFTDSVFKCWITKTGNNYYELCRMLVLINIFYIL